MTVPPQSATPPPTEGSPRSRRLWRGIFAAFGIVAFSYLVYRSDPPHVAKVIVGLPAWVIFALCFFPLGLSLDALGWKRLLLRLGARIDVPSALLSRLAAEAVGNSLPMGGLGAEAVGPVVLARRTGIPLRSAVSSSLAKRWLISRAHGSYVLLCVALSFAAGGLRGLRVDVAVATAIALLLASALTQAAAAHARPAERVRAVLARLPLVGSKVTSRKDDFAETDGEISHLARKFTADAYLCVLGAWIVEGLETYVLLRAVGVEISLPAALALDGIMTALRSAAVVVPSGLGVQDIGYAAALGPGPTTAAFLVLKRTKELFYIGVGYAIMVWLGGGAPAAAGHGAPARRHELVT